MQKLMKKAGVDCVTTKNCSFLEVGMAVVSLSVDSGLFFFFKKRTLKFDKLKDTNEQFGAASVGIRNKQL